MRAWSMYGARSSPLVRPQSWRANLSRGSRGWWSALDRGTRIAAVGLATLVAGAIAVRVWLIVGYGPAFVGFGDSHEYITAARLGVFHDVQKPAGYPIFLALLHALSDRLTFTIVVQHALGVATGLLLCAAVRRTGAPPWLGFAPAAIAFFGGTGLLLEHSLLADPLFAFLQAFGVYAAVRAMSNAGLRWALVAGIATGASFWVKTVGLSSVVLVPCVLLAGGTGLRAGLRRAAAAAATAAVLVLGYAAVQAQVTGYFGYERQGAWNLYGRVATFVDCARFTPPAGTRFLCPREPVARRASQSFYQYARAAPAVERFGGPADAPASANALLQRFSVAAIVDEPLAYVGAVAHSLTLYVSPRASEGYTPASVREALLEAKGSRSIEPALSAYYPHSRGYVGSASAAGALDAYERHTRIQGAPLIAMLLVALIGAPLLPDRARAAALLFTLTAIGSVVLAAAGNSYDARYGYPAFAPLAAGAALGAWGLARRLRLARGPRSAFNAKARRT
ncbi:MAG TPA: hypothetical protein VGX69_04405 [Solirubrobacteraceae bacterium]|nr:hypothetical protein [Solirubrobacteraceae bacterium]